MNSLFEIQVGKGATLTGALRVLRGLVAVGATALAWSAWAQAVGAPDIERPTTGAATFEGRIIATELPTELRQLIDAARRLHEEPGLILRREEIERTIGARLVQREAMRNTEGWRILSEEFVNEGPLSAPFWEGQLAYYEYKDQDAWSLTIALRYARSIRGHPAIMCYPSRLLEAYWARPFVFRPIDVHEQLREWTLPAGVPATGPHDGRPYRAEFRAPHQNSANVTFHIGGGGCLSSIRMSRLFSFKEYSDEHIYHE
jgi:hypothetical protein